MREGVPLILSRWLLRCVGEFKKLSSRLMWVRVKYSKRDGRCFYRHTDLVVSKERRRSKNPGIS